MRPICAAEACEREAQSAGYCGGHYQRLRKGQDLSTPIKGPYSPKPDCGVPGCERPRRYSELCAFHYLRQWQGKSLDDPVRVTSPHGVRTARDDQGRKQCSDCHEWLTLDHFGSQPRSGDGLRARCRACTRIWSISDKYGLTAAQFEDLFERQGRACAICGATDAKWCIDHDHSCCPGDRNTCGQCVRGILCDPCNVGLARFADSPARLQSAIDYLAQGA